MGHTAGGLLFYEPSKIFCTPSKHASFKCSNFTHKSAPSNIAQGRLMMPSLFHFRENLILVGVTLNSQTIDLVKSYDFQSKKSILYRKFHQDTVTMTLKG